MRILPFAWIAAFLMMGGCQSYEKRSYDVSVQNYSNTPVTLWLTKTGEPYENGWLAPEDIAIESPNGRQSIIGGVIVPPGKIASTGPREGRFRPETDAVLRVYEGQLSFIDLLAVNRESPLRQDVTLPPGQIQISITGSDSPVRVQILPAK